MSKILRILLIYEGLIVGLVGGCGKKAKILRILSLTS